MSFVGKVGRNRPRARLAMIVLYIILTIGAITTLYPFGLMVATGLKGPTDQNDNRLIPAYFNSFDDLLKKYLNDKYAGDPSRISSSRIGADAPPSAVSAYRQFLTTLPVPLWKAGFANGPNEVTGKLCVRYQAWLRNRFKTIEALNAAYGEENVAFQTEQPPTELLERIGWKPTLGKRYDDWLIFKSQLPVEFRLPIRQVRLYQEWMRMKTKGQFKDVPASLVGHAKKFEELEIPDDAHILRQFHQRGIPASFQGQSIEDRWAKLNPSYPVVPIAAEETDWVRTRESSIKSEFAGRNYGYVIDYVLINGRAVWNTLFFCALMIGTQLFVNPIAAYALSRYPIRWSGQILVFLLATMAFPAEVAAIPSFLLLKELGLLNTFAALVLPGAASGYMIFLLKGFFDSLPQELFEAGSIDGAPETTMMMRIALPLSRPVLGYLALNAFMGAYGAFLYAFLIAQDQKIWTLMVWVYQLQLIAPKAVMMAALTIAALPTLIVFLLAQRVIMRGIVLPGER